MSSPYSIQDRMTEFEKKDRARILEAREEDKKAREEERKAPKNMQEKRAVMTKASLSLQTKLYPSFTRRLLNKMKPDIAFGPSAGVDVDGNIRKLTLITFGSMIMGILSTLAWYYREGEGYVDRILIAVFSISWFVFVSFIFLIFEKTRLLHILIFMSVLILCAAVQDEYASNHKDTTVGYRLNIAVMVIAFLCTLVLTMYFFASGRDEEIMSLKSAEVKRKEMENIKKFISEQSRELAAEDERKLNEKYGESSTGINRRLAEALVTDINFRAGGGKLLVSGGKGGGGGAEDKKKQQKKQKEALLALATKEDEEEE
jgi:hypothetical protein